jgi:hypothetical protein
MIICKRKQIFAYSGSDLFLDVRMLSIRGKRGIRGHSLRIPHFPQREALCPRNKLLLLILNREYTKII